MTSKRSKSGTLAKGRVTTAESKAYLKALRTHRRVIDAADCPGPLPPGVTHVLEHPDDGPPILTEKRKSFI